MAIVKRLDKGSALTYAELDGNFDHLTAADAAHAALTNNPHSVTAAQVGLGNVDNTADLDKPVSTATQTAIDNHVNDTAGAHADSAITFTPAGTGAEASTVQTKLRESVSVKDFGAVGNGVTDDYAAFLACVTAVNAAGGGIAFIPPGTYLLGTPLQMKEFENVHIIGAGRGATVITKDDNFTAASFRFYMGTNNSIRHLTLDCDGYDGRGIYLQDVRSWAEDVEVLDCPSRAFGMNGGGNASYGLDTNGDNEDDAGWDGTPVFYPSSCKIIRCYVYNSGQTAISQKRMRNSEIIGNLVNTCYSEGVTVDVGSTYSTVANNLFINVSREDGSTAFPDKVAGSGYLTIGGGGVGGCGIDNSSHACIANNHWVGVQMDTATRNNRSNPALNFVNNVGASYGCKVIGNTFRDCKVGIYVKAGTGGNNFKHIIADNTFEDTGTDAGTGSTEYGDVWVDAASTGNVIQENTHVNGTLLLTVNAVENNIDYSSSITMTATSADFSAPPADATWLYTVSGRTVSIDIPTLSGTSATTTFSFSTTLPIHLRPSTTKYVLARIRDNTSTYGVGLMVIGPGGGVTLYPTQLTSTGWTASGTKAILETVVTYQKDQ